MCRFGGYGLGRSPGNRCRDSSLEYFRRVLNAGLEKPRFFEKVLGF